MISNKARAMTSKRKVMDDIRKWRDSEDLFKKLVPQLTDGSRQDDINHVDVHVNGAKIDVKGLKEPHKQGYLLLEMLNVQGLPGWCNSNSGAEFIAFLFPDGFYVTEKDDLVELLRTYMPPYSPEAVTRKNGHNKNIINNVFKYCGRANRADLFTFVPKEYLMKIPFYFIPVNQ